MLNCPGCHSALPDGALFCGECGRSATAPVVRRWAVEDSRPSDTTIVEPLPKPAVAGPAPTTPIIRASKMTAASQPTFIFSASTGERIRVTTGGLLGRRPVAQTGENPELVVTLADQSRSISKTHLEFGIDGDQLWVCDLYSANGTSIVLGSGTTWICEPGRRYRVERGARLLLGEQHVDVS